MFIKNCNLDMPGCVASGKEASDHLLYDHRPLKLNDDDYQRVCQIPKKKVCHTFSFYSPLFFLYDVAVTL